jgi:uncharacterized 2Fe-2S/4Fe-4S cluster protein (DUF4445 family)
MSFHSVTFSTKTGDVSAAVPDGASLLEAARKAGLVMESPCNGAGSCGKCRVKAFAERAESLERKISAHRLSSEDEAIGWTLGCQTLVHGDARVEMTEAALHEKLEILAEGNALNVAVKPWISKRHNATLDVTDVMAGCRVIASEDGDTTGALYGLAVDIGTTTLVAALVDLNTGRELGAASALNPQARHAQDVLSRISMGSDPQGLETLHNVLASELNLLIGELTAKLDIRKEHIYEAVYAGNTTMITIAVGRSPQSLGRFPYKVEIDAPAHYGAREVGLDIARAGLVWLPPVISAYVGADLTAGLLATRLDKLPGSTLLVDVGTNGEMILAVNGKLTATSTAAGPAFEGMNITSGMRASKGAIERVSLSGGVEIRTIGNASPIGLCGSGVLDAIGELAAHGIVDRNGRFTAPDSSIGRRWARNLRPEQGKATFHIAGPVVVTQRDVRQVQLAKGAVRAGIDLILRSAGLRAEDVDRVLIAGSFGYHLRTKSLLNLGMLPPGFRDRVEFVGNTSKSGAAAFLVNCDMRREVARIVKDVTTLELANAPDFQPTFISSLAFPEPDANTELVETR